MEATSDDQKPLKLYAYLRVSTNLQVEGTSLHVQENAIKRYCEAYNYTIVKWFKDEGVSAYKFRPNFQRMFEAVISDNSEVDGVIVFCLSRFGRSTEELLRNVRMFNDNGKTLISTKESINLDTKEGRFMFGQWALFADFERDTLVERMSEGRAYADKNGSKSGKPCHRPRKDIPWDQVLKYRRIKISWSQISQILNQGKTDKKDMINRQTLINRAKEEGYYDD